MSAPGIQLSSDARVTFFEPSVRQYLQKIEQEVASNNLPAARRTFEQLDKTVRSSASPGTNNAANQPSAQVIENLQNVGKALESSDLQGAAQAVGALRQQLSVPSIGEQDGEENSSDQTAAGVTEDSGVSESAQKINVRI
jgi:hypothetical protein